MPNPSGVNSFTPPGPEVPYGSVQENATLQRSAPLAGATEAARGRNAPRRAQRTAVRGGGAEAPTGPPPQMPGQPGQIAPQAEVAMFWQLIAQQPGASDLVKSIAQEAAGGNQNVPAA